MLCAVVLPVGWWWCWYRAMAAQMALLRCTHRGACETGVTAAGRTAQRDRRYLLHPALAKARAGHLLIIIAGSLLWRASSHSTAVVVQSAPVTIRCDSRMCRTAPACEMELEPDRPHALAGPLTAGPAQASSAPTRSGCFGAGKFRGPLRLI